MRKQDDEPIFGRWDMFFLGICAGSILGNALLYFILELFLL